MRAAISKIIGLMIFISAACAFADTKLPKCVIFTFGNCQGSLKYPNGDIYTGEFNYGQPNGAGKMTYVNGDLYAGNFFEGQKHGVGDYTWADGNRYIGQFIGGNLEGRGAYYFLSKNKSNPDKYVGDFKKNVFNGDGIYTYGNGAVVSGKFKDGKKVNVSTPVQVTEVKKTPDAVGAENELNKLGVEASNKVNGISENNQAPVNKELMALSDYSDGVINGNSLSGKNSIPSKITNSIGIRDISSPNGYGGFYGQIATGYENYNYGSINSNATGNGLTFTGTSPNQSTSGMPSILGIGYNFRISDEYMIGIGYDYSFQTQSTSNFPWYVTRSSGGSFIVNNNSFKVSNRYNLYVNPGYVLSKEALVYLKAGYSSEKFQYDHIADPPSNTPEITGSKNMDGYILGLGYKQRIFEDLYGFAEANYMVYKNTLIDVNFISGGNITGTFNPTLNSYNFLLGVGYKF